MARPSSDEQARLRRLIEESLRRQGFRIRDGQIVTSKNPSKQRLRHLHSMSVWHRVEQARRGLERYEDRLLRRIASGREVDPAKVTPRLVEVLPDTEDELLFRYASLHWSIPTSSGYGRRLRFLVEDAHNDKLIGLIGLCDPVFSLAARDEWIGWDVNARKARLRNVLEAFILGAVPPYSMLLGGKLVAMLCGSDEVRRAFQHKYGRGESVITGATADGRLALITTTSALGRSSIYNRLRYHDRLLMVSVGYTRGWGEFQFSNGVYAQIREYAEKYCPATAKHKSWGTGFRNRREVVRRVLAELGLSGRWLNHGIRRELFVMPLAKNSCEFLRGEHQQLLWFHQSAEELIAFFRERWLLPRAERHEEYRRFRTDTYRLWDQPRLFDPENFENSH